MAKIYNSDLSRELRVGARLQQNVDRIPDELADKVVPVMEVNPKLLRRCNIVRSINKITSGSITLFASPSDKDFYITQITLGICKDAACNHTTGQIYVSCAIDGATIYPVTIPILTLTAQDNIVSITLPFPIKVDRGSSMVCGAPTFALGTSTTTASVVGYTDDMSAA